MSYSNDLADALLLLQFNSQRAFVVKGRNVGKTAAMRQHQGMYLVAPTTITFADLQAAYDRAMKSNPNPYLGTPPFTATGPKVQLSYIDAAIRVDMLPDWVADIDGADAFDSWTWHGFTDGMSKKIGIISARHIATNTHCQHRFYLARDLVDEIIGRSRSFEVDRLLNVIDSQLMNAVSDIVASMIPPHDINTCKDPECKC